jgi:exodeoxyribonuclease VII large subunit
MPRDPDLFMPREDRPDRPVLTVTELNRTAKSLIEGALPLVWVEGEISNLARPASGHLYFTLKDAQSQVRCALFRGSQRGELTRRLHDGMQVIARARPSLYEGRGEFQLIVDHLEEAGEGALRRAFELLKKRLGEEGLFDAALKRALPRLPRRIGIVTSPTGAVVHDILTTLHRRFPAIPVVIYPVPVQGAGAAEQIAAMLRKAGARRDCDVLILARGGGSLEDLQAFNEEIVARAIRDCALPVVCGVGHETDITIADFAADARAPTPTAAAELLSPDSREWLAQCQSFEARLMRYLRGQLRERMQRLDWLRARLVHPQARLRQLSLRLAAASRHLLHAQQSLLESRRHQTALLQERLRATNPLMRLRETSLRLRHAGQRLTGAWKHHLAARQERLRASAGRLEILSPLATLARGYALVSDEQGILRDARATRPGHQVTARLARGTLVCEVKETHDENI